MRILMMAASVALAVSCGPDDSGTSGGSSSGTNANLSASFTSLSCASSACHGTDGKGASLTDDTNLTESDLDLAGWTDIVRTNAESPMPTFSAELYSDADLLADYTALTGRTE